MDEEAATRELVRLADKLLAVEEQINDYEAEPGQARRIEVKLQTAQRRLTLITMDEAAVTARKLAIANDLETLTARFAAMRLAIELIPQEPRDQPNPQQATESVHVHKHVPVARWGIQFHGETKDLSLGAFLERVNELKEARHITEDQMWLEASDLFTGPASVWFRSVKRRLTTWKELIAELEREFQPLNYDDQLKAEILCRTQGADERLGIYFASLDNLFHRLNKPIPEQEQLDIARRNLLPYFTDRLLFQEIPDMSTLRTLCRKIEEVRQETAAFRPPPEARNSLEPDLGYASQRKRSVLNAVTSQTKPFAARAPTTCWNCSHPGHRFRRCTEPKKLTFCHGCGRPKGDQEPGKTSSYCTSCQGKGRDSRRSP